MRQADIFMETEGDAWLQRNPHHPDRDPVCEAINHVGIKPESVIEIGCSTGWRLKALRDRFGCSVAGVDPSEQAGKEAIQRRIPVHRCTAEALPVSTDGCDLIIYGFCLYLTDPCDWFRIAAEGDRVLKDGGYLIIYDFVEPGRAFARKYRHRDDVLSYHMNYSGLWLVHPWYRRIYRHREEAGGYVTVLRKTVAGAFPVQP